MALKYDMPDGDARDTLQLVGQCLQAWSWVERELSDLASSLMGLDAGDRSLDLVLAEVRSFHDRLWAVKSLAEHKLARNSPQIFELWELLASRIYKDDEERNKVAHFHLVATNDKNGKMIPVVAPYFTRAAFETGNIPLLDAAALNDLRKRFDETSQGLRYIKFRLGFPPEPGDLVNPPEPPIFVALRNRRPKGGQGKSSPPT